MTPTETLPHFATILPDGRWKLRVDHHILNTFSQCEQLGAYSHIDLWRPKARGGAIGIGIWWARCLEMFYKELSFGSLPPLEHMMKFAVDTWVECRDKGELGDTSKFGDDAAALLMATQYYDKYASLDFKDWKIVAAEAGFGLRDEIRLTNDGDEDIDVYYVGKPDLFVYEYSSGKLVAVDHKTIAYIEKRTHLKYKPHPQTAGYVYVGRELARQLGYETTQTGRCIVNIAARKEPSDKPRDGVKKPRFLRVYPNYSVDELEEWRRGVIMKCRRLRQSIETGEFIRRESACHLYAGCSYRGVCSVPQASRQIVLAADFVKSEPWRPYSPTEEEEDGA